MRVQLFSFSGLLYHGRFEMDEIEEAIRQNVVLGMRPVYGLKVEDVKEAMSQLVDEAFGNTPAGWRFFVLDPVQLGEYSGLKCHRCQDVIKNSDEATRIEGRKYAMLCSECSEKGELQDD